MQARLWRQEIEVMARKRQPMLDDTVIAMATQLAVDPAFAAQEGIAPQGVSEAERLDAIILYLRNGTRLPEPTV